MWEGASPDSGVSASHLALTHRDRESVPSHISFQDACVIFVSKYPLYRIFTTHPRQFSGFFCLLLKAVQRCTFSN